MYSNNSHLRQTQVVINVKYILYTVQCIYICNLLVFVVSSRLLLSKLADIDLEPVL